MGTEGGNENVCYEHIKKFNFLLILWKPLQSQCIMGGIFILIIDLIALNIKALFEIIE